MSALDRLLEHKETLLADGAMGTSLFALGLETGDSPEAWNVLHPERVREVHTGFVEAGADIILTNSFGANRLRLALHGLEDRVGELNRRAVEIARAAAEGADHRVLVAGSIGPSGEILAPLGALAADDATRVFEQQALALAGAGADLIWIETMSSADELAAAVRGAGAAGLPICATMTFDTNGRTMMGLTPAAALQVREALTPRPAAFGANCGVHPQQLVESVRALAAAAPLGDVLIAKGNCGIPRYEDGSLRYDGTPEVMADYAAAARDAGARIIGGCCGTTAGHLRAMATALATRPARSAEAMASLATASSPAAPAPRHRRRNRRLGTT